LRIGLPCDSSALRQQADKLLEANQSPDAVLRIHRAASDPAGIPRATWIRHCSSSPHIRSLPRRRHGSWQRHPFGCRR
jgi:hypothetical protein